MSRPYINREMRMAVAWRHGGRHGEVTDTRCHYCGDGIVIDWSDHRRVRFLDQQGRPRPELDHVEPLYHGGPHTADNLVPACLSCNRSKGPRRLPA